VEGRGAAASRALLSASVGAERATAEPGRGRIHDAVVQAGQALRLHYAAGERRGGARALYAIGWYLVQLGGYQQAAGFSSQAFMAYCELGPGIPWIILRR
jgi:hypothetical protein